MKKKSSLDGLGLVVTRIFGRVSSAKYGANSSSASSAMISGSRSATIVGSTSRALSSVLGCCFGGASSPSASVSR